LFVAVAIIGLVVLQLEDKSGQSVIFTEAIGFNVPEWHDEVVGPLPQWRPY
jgi:hypothetical protein